MKPKILKFYNSNVREEDYPNRAPFISNCSSLESFFFDYIKLEPHAFLHAGFLSNFISSNDLDRMNAISLGLCWIKDMTIAENNKLNLNLIFKKIFELKINDVLVESGGIFFTNLLKSNLVDELHLFTAPFVIGKSGKSILVNNKIENLNMREILNKKIGNNIYQQFDIL